MFNIGDKVLHQSEGACYITEIVEHRIDSVMNKYYQLESVIDRDSKVFVSTAKHRRIRAVIDKNTLRESEKQMHTELYLWPKNPMERYKEFHKNMETFDFSGTLKVYRSLTLESKKSKLLIKDEQLRKLSERLVCSEIAIILNRSYEFVRKEVASYIIKSNKDSIIDSFVYDLK